MSKPGHRFTSDRLRLSAPTRPTSAARLATAQLYPTTRPISAYQHQTSSCISTTQPTPATLVERPAANNYNATIPANDVTHPSWRLHTTATDIYIHVCNSGNKIVTFVVSIDLPSIFLHCLWPHTHSRALNLNYLRSRHAYRLRNRSTTPVMYVWSICTWLHSSTSLGHVCKVVCVKFLNSFDISWISRSLCF